MNLLLIDDDTIDRMNTKRALMQSGYSVEITEVSSSEKGLKLAQDKNFDLILLDYELPEMNGLTFIKRFKKTDDKSAAVVMLSHCEDDDLAIKCIEAGAQDFVTKREITASRLIRAILHAKERCKIELQLRESHEKLRDLAELDTLTGLANRYMFDIGLKRALPLSNRLGKSLALVLLDLDNFKSVNDTLGHVAGDELLVEVAKRLRAPIRDSDLLCRLGGDEFAILVQNLDDIATVRLLTHRILTVLANPMIIEGCEIVVSASIGIASYPECASDVNQLMKCADIAMYQSKESGRNQAHFYSSTLNEQILKQVEIERELRSALERKAFVLYYQPLIDAETEKVVGVEALVRWQHPTRGLLCANEFISIAEEIGVIDKIAIWVLDEACAQFQQWLERYKVPGLKLSIAVNISAIKLVQQDYFRNISETLSKHKIPPGCIELELNENALSKLTEGSARQLEQLAKSGILLALDEFGAGNSSLMHLQRYPFKVLNIDKSIIQSDLGHAGEGQFLKAINAFAKQLQLRIVAKGVENEAQKNACQKLVFDRLQGYHFAKPMPANEFELYIKNNLC